MNILPKNSSCNQQTLFSGNLVLARNDEAGCYHDLGQHGFFAVLTQKPGEDKVQRSFRLEMMPTVLDLLPSDHDSWLSQAEFLRPNRRIVNLARIGLLFADLDTYKMPAFRGQSPDQLVAALLSVCDEQGIPEPSLVIFSGQGLQAKWLLDGVLPRAALPRWNACQRYLVDKLSALGADPAARDASRVLRIVQTSNSKTGEMVRVVHVTEENGEPIRYGFEYLAEYLLPFSRDQLAEAKEAKRARLELIEGGRKGKDGLRAFSSRQLSWHRVEDLRKLADIRGGVEEGERMLHLHWRTNFLLGSGATHSRQMYYEAEALAREIAPGWRYGPPELGTLYRKAQEMEAGVTVEWNGRKYPPLYTPKNQTLIDLFKITDDEQRQLRTIISPSIAAERHAERERARRRAAGALSREEYRDQIKKPAQDKQAHARKLRERGLSVREIAREMGIGKSAVALYLKNGSEPA